MASGRTLARGADPGQVSGVGADLELERAEAVRDPGPGGLDHLGGLPHRQGDHGRHSPPAVPPGRAGRCRVPPWPHRSRPPARAISRLTSSAGAVDLPDDGVAQRSLQARSQPATVVAGDLPDLRRLTHPDPAVAVGHPAPRRSRRWSRSAARSRTACATAGSAAPASTRPIVLTGGAPTPRGPAQRSRRCPGRSVRRSTGSAPPARTAPRHGSRTIAMSWVWSSIQPVLLAIGVPGGSPAGMPCAVGLAAHHVLHVVRHPRGAARPTPARRRRSRCRHRWPAGR